MATYKQPTAPAHAADLVPMDDHSAQLTPETRVLCINRGQKPLRDKYAGRDYLIPPGHFYAQYGQALFFQRHQVIPGSRDPISGKQSSWIGIVNVDSPERCEPFTPEQCAAFDAEPEALAHADRQVVPTARLAPAVLAGGLAAEHPAVDLQQPAQKAEAQAALAAPDAGDNVAIQEMRAHAQSFKSEGADEAATARPAGKGVRR